MTDGNLIEITCRWCDQSFFLCQSCWRCQAYCSKLCRAYGYRRYRQKRQDKYRNTKKGKKTRRKAERKRSLGQSSKKSGDATSNTDSSVLPSSEIHLTQQPYCQLCGRNGLVVDHFPRRRYGNSVSVAVSNNFRQPRGHNDTKNPTRQVSSPFH